MLQVHHVQTPYPRAGRRQWCVVRCTCTQVQGSGISHGCRHRWRRQDHADPSTLDRPLLGGGTSGLVWASRHASRGVGIHTSVAYVPQKMDVLEPVELPVSESLPRAMVIMDTPHCTWPGPAGSCVRVCVELSDVCQLRVLCMAQRFSTMRWSSVAAWRVWTLFCCCTPWMTWRRSPACSRSGSLSSRRRRLANTTAYAIVWRAACGPPGVAAVCLSQVLRGAEHPGVADRDEG